MPGDGGNEGEVRRGRRLRRAPPQADATGEALIRTLYVEHGRLLLAVAFRLTGDRQAAEDIVQETFLRAWRHADRLTEDQGSVRGWLLTVTRNIAIDRVRAARLRVTEVPVRADDPAETPGTQPVPDHADAVADAVVVAEALESLSPQHRDALVETYFRGRTAAEAGEVLGVPAGTIKSRVHYALRELRTIMTSPAEVAP